MAIPSIVAACFCLNLSKSPKYCAVSGDTIALKEILERIAKVNGKQLPNGNVEFSVTESEDRGNIKELFNESNRSKTLLLVCMFICSGIVLYCVIFLPTLGLEDMISKDNGLITRALVQCKHCLTLKISDYYSILESSVAELSGTLLACFLVRFKKARMMYIVLSGISSVLIESLVKTGFIYAVRLYLLRVICSSIATYLLTIQSFMYKTHLRGSASGLSSMAYGIGAVIGPTIAQVITVYNPILSLVVLSMITASCTILLCCFTLLTATDDVDD